MQPMTFDGASDHLPRNHGCAGDGLVNETAIGTTALDSIDAETRDTLTLGKANPPDAI